MKSHFFDKSLAGIYDKVGGIEVFRRISKRFHHKVDDDPVLRHFFPTNMAALEERLALYLAERSGGPSEYTAARGKTSLLCRHAHIAIGSLEADHWLGHLSESLAEECVSADASVQLIANLTKLAATLADPLVLLYDLPIEALREKLKEDPSLARLNDHGRNLIGAAAIDWDVPRLRLLLEFGADAKMDGGAHNPLYRVANGQGLEEDGLAALELLIAHGADVNQVTGVGGMTPLHMSARRGTTFIAGALLNAGANIDARDSNGQTPLRRAVNCGYESMVLLLLSKGANPDVMDRKGMTPRQAARTDNMRRLLANQS